MKPAPLYHPHNLNPAYHLRYSWAGWLSRKSQYTFPVEMNTNILAQTTPLWEKDGLRILESNWMPDSILLTFSTKPAVSPLLLAARTKGRLQHAFRVSGNPCKFSRKVGVRSVGKNQLKDIESYIKNQVQKSSYIDSSFKKKLKQFTFTDKSVDLSLPTATNSGRYWYDLHIVLVVENRYRITEYKKLAIIRDGCIKIAEKRKYRLSGLSVMPEHLHLSLRADIEHSPQDVVLIFQNNLAYMLGQIKVWSHNYYAGTFGIYDMNAIRRKRS